VDLYEIRFVHIELVLSPLFSWHRRAKSVTRIYRYSIHNRVVHSLEKSAASDRRVSACAIFVLLESFRYGNRTKDGVARNLRAVVIEPRMV
jgi:hypothetical protein